MAAPDVSIVIRTKNQRRFLKESLEIIFKQHTTYSVEVIVVDSGSTDGALDIAREYINAGLPVHLVPIELGEGETFNYAYALNQGVWKAQGKYIVSLSGDATPANSAWLDALIEPFSKPTVAGVYGAQVPREGARWVERLKLRLRYDNQPREQRASHIFSTANGTVRARLARHLPFDESLLDCEDYDWARKVQSKGWVIVYAPEAKVLHSHDHLSTSEHVWRILRFWLRRKQIDRRPLNHLSLPGPFDT